MKGRPVWLVLALLALGCGAGYAQRHRVAPGETVDAIAARYGVSPRELRAYNRLADADRVRPGDIVFVPTARPPRSAPAPSSPSDASARRTPPAPPTPVEPAPDRTARPAPPPSPARAAFRWPVEGPVLRGFGTGPAGESRGVDIGAAVGSPVRAAADGRVTYAGTPARAYGPLVILEHSSGLYTVYANLETAGVRTGDRVRAGQVVGTSGAAEGDQPAHLHFEVRRGDAPQDPLLFLPVR
ncbi:MAG: peptidoglycan DD-metalloendopeptidase family protein [Deferrisomatales bacterium]